MNLLFSNCNPRYNLMGPTKNHRQSTNLSREVCRKHSEVMVSIQKEWSSSYNHRSSSRVESGGFGKVRKALCLEMFYSDRSSRVVRKFQTKDATVAKLFAKHIKLKDSVKFLKSTRTGIAVGTPTRLKDLMDDGLSPFPAWQTVGLTRDRCTCYRQIRTDSD